MIRATAPGKLMLLGEHAVVYGQPSLVTAVDQRLSVDIEKTTDGKITIDAPQVKDTRFVEEAIRLGSGLWHISHSGLKLATESSFSGKYGLGSSAAVTVATLKALAVTFGKQIDSRALFDAAYRVVMNIQGVGSGFDVASAAFGGTLYFMSGGKVIEPLTLKDSMPLVIGYTGVKSNSVDIVKDVAKKREEYPQRVNRIMEAIGKLVLQARDAVTAGDWERLGKYMDFDQEYLRDLGVSSEKLEALIAAAKKAGAWGAKLSGAGVGDCMIALHPGGTNGKRVVEEAIKNAGGEIVPAHPHAPGARVETTDDQGELFVVVDTEDNVLGFRSRYDCHHDKTLIHRGVSLLIFDDTGRVLLQKRSMSKDTNPGYWSTAVGGHVAKGESYEDAIRRETREELGVNVQATLKAKFIHEFDHEVEMEALFVASANGPFSPNTEEIDDIAFISKNELPRKLLSREIRLTSLAERALQLTGFLPS